MSTLTYGYFEYEPSFSSWGIWNVIRTKMKDLSLFNVVKLLNSQNTYEIEILSELWHINLYIIIPITIRHIMYRTHDNEICDIISLRYTINDLQHLKMFSTCLAEQNGGMWKTSFSSRQNAKKIFNWNIKTKYATCVWLSQFSSMKDYTCHYRLSTNKWNAYLKFNKHI